MTRRIGIFLVVGLALAAGIYFGQDWFAKTESAPPLPRLKTGGTSVVQIILQNRWRTAYRDEKSVVVDYDSTGSSAGVAKMIDKEYAIGFTHAPMNPEQLKKAKEKGGEVLQIPVVVCSVVPVYNLKELKDKPPLKFTGEVLAQIFLGKIVKWNDPALMKLNEGVKLPDTKIDVAHRKDSSGTTFLFAEYLEGESEAWKKEMGPAKSELKWPGGAALERNEGLAGYIRKTEGSIGYVDLLHAFHGDFGNLDFGAVQNKDKTAFIHAGPATMAAAARAGSGQVSDDLIFKLVDMPGKDSYPICGVVWAVLYKSQAEANRTLVTDFLHWVCHEGQKFAPKTNYAALPDEIIEKIDKKLKEIKPAS